MSPRLECACLYSSPKRAAETIPEGKNMPIIEDYGAIAKRLRELRAAVPKGADEITELELRRDLARMAREYIESRHRPHTGRLILPQPTD